MRIFRILSTGAIYTSHERAPLGVWGFNDIFHIGTVILAGGLQAALFAFWPPGYTYIAPVQYKPVMRNSE